MSRHLTVDAIERELKEAFKLFDDDGDGKITKAELVRALTRPVPNHSPFTVAQADDIFARADLNGDGFVDFDEFSKAWSRNLFRSTGGAFPISPPPPPGQKADSTKAPPDFSQLDPREICFAAR